MPRPRRVHVPSGRYHVILRGNHRQAIFFHPGDRDRWERIVAEALQDHGATLHAYCWMTNHVHMLVQVQTVPLGQIVHRMASRYARWFQRQLATTGHLFERRHRAILVQTDAQLLALVRYIHWNPVRAGIVLELENYSWSSHRHYLGLRDQPWLATDRVLGTFNEDRERARQAYRQFMQAEPKTPPALGGSLATEARGDLRIDTPPLPRVAATPGCLALDDLVARIAVQYGLTVEILCSPSRARPVARVRAIVAWQAQVSGVATLSDVARRFGRSPAAMSLAVSGLRRAHLDAIGPGNVYGRHLKNLKPGT